MAETMPQLSDSDSAPSPDYASWTPLQRYAKLCQLRDFWSEHECCKWECIRANELESEIRFLALDIIDTDMDPPELDSFAVARTLSQLGDGSERES